MRTPRRTWRRRAVRLLLVGVLAATLAAACSPGPDDGVTTPSPAPGTVPGASPDPRPATTDPATPETTATPAPPATDSPRGMAGDVVLLHLEGPVTRADATDLVIRDDEGLEVDRFRLPGAVQIHGGHLSRHAVIATNDGQWARFDATSNRLALLRFEDGDPPATSPRLAGPTAWWDDPAAPWVVRLDTGATLDLRPFVGDEGATVSATVDGTHLLVRGAGDHVVDTEAGTVRTLPAQRTVRLDPAGGGITSTADAADAVGVDVYVEQVDGSDRRMVGTVGADGVPVLLPDGRVLVAGPAGGLFDEDGPVLADPPGPEPGADPGLEPEPAGPAATGTPTAPEPQPVVVPAVAGALDALALPGGRRVLVATATGLVLIDLDALSATPVPDSDGMPLPSPPDDAPTVLWTTSADPDEPGALALDARTGEATALVGTAPTTAVAGTSADGRTALVRTGEGGADAVVLSLGGEVQQHPRVAGAALHPDGEALAVAVLSDTQRSLQVLADGAVVVEVPTGRAPAWVLTGREQRGGG